MAAKILVKESAEKSTFWITFDELRIIEDIALGKTSKEIAIERSLSLRTVEERRYRAMKRLHCRNMPHLITLLFREKILL